MIVENPHELKSLLAKDQRLMAFDLGEKRIGLALSDRTLMIATPLTIVLRKKFKDLLVELAPLIAEHAVGGLVVGLPMNMNGTEGPRCDSARQMAKNLSEALSLPVLLWDERLSSAAVERTLIEADTTRKRRKEVTDKLAAAYILQGFLDRLR